MVGIVCLLSIVRCLCDRVLSSSGVTSFDQDVSGMPQVRFDLPFA
jgi:hypothetical protein